LPEKYCRFCQKGFFEQKAVKLVIQKHLWQPNLHTFLIKKNLCRQRINKKCVKLSLADQVAIFKCFFGFVWLQNFPDK
jgi:hypothetical protein